MAAHKFSSIELAAVHEPDTTTEKDAAGNSVEKEIPGLVHIGALVDGVFVPFVTKKASGLLSDIAALKPKRPARSSSSSAKK